jgi:lipoprotein signal peptidase
LLADEWGFPWLSRIVFNLSDFGIMVGAMMAALAAGWEK